MQQKEIKKNYYFIGIGGVSMSGLAEILVFLGHNVCGSDKEESRQTLALREKNVEVYIGHDDKHMKNKAIDYVVYTSAISEDNVEYQYAKAKGIPLIERARLLGIIMERYNNSITISGTHGKTSTTAMISQILMENKKDPTVSLGGILDFLGGNIKIGSSSFFVAEACEYCNNFLKLSPQMNVILNIETDHLDFFKDLDDIRNSFRQFANKTKEDGVIIINSAIENYEEIVKDAKAKVMTFGKNKTDTLRYTDITYDGFGNTKFHVEYKGNIYDFDLTVPGEHNLLNAMAAICAGLYYEIPYEEIKKSLKNFKGALRRFQQKGEYNGAKIYDDYAHHPTEIKACIKAAKNIKHKRLIIVFQPHTYTRTKTLLDDFSKSFKGADYVIVSEIYAAREINKGDIHSADLVEKIVKEHIEAVYYKDFKNIENFLKGYLQEGDLLITVGAGNVYKIGENLIK